MIAHLGTLDFVTAKENVVFLGPPGTGKTHLATGLAIRACQAGHRVLFATAVAMGRPARRRPPRRPAAGRAGPAGPLPAAGRRRGRLHPLRTRSREPVLPARLLPLRAGQPDRHQQQALRPLGRGVRRRRRRRRHDRPPRPPRRGHRPQGRQLPAQEPRPWPRPCSQHGRRAMTVPTTWNWPTRPPQAVRDINHRTRGAGLHRPGRALPARRRTRPARRWPPATPGPTRPVAAHRTRRRPPANRQPHRRRPDRPRRNRPPGRAGDAAHDLAHVLAGAQRRLAHLGAPNPPSEERGPHTAASRTSPTWPPT